MKNRRQDTVRDLKSPHGERGHACVEYLFMMALVIFAAIAGIAIVGSTTLDLYMRAKNTIPQ